MSNLLWIHLQSKYFILHEVECLVKYYARLPKSQKVKFCIFFLANERPATRKLPNVSKLKPSLRQLSLIRQFAFISNCPHVGGYRQE